MNTRSLPYVNEIPQRWGPRFFSDNFSVVSRVCPSLIEASNDIYTVDSTCPFASLDEDGVWTADSTLHFASSEHATTDESV